MSASGLRSELTEAPTLAVPAFVRARGRISVEAVRRGALTVRADVHESGTLRARFPREHLDRLDLTLVNVAGGMTGGDVFEMDFAAGANSEFFISSAAAEKIYRSDGPTSEIRVRLNADAGATCIWLPQETIIFNGARLSRRLDADVAPDARLLACEMTILGRAAMSESMENLSWRERWRIRSGDRLIFAEDTRVEGDAAQLLTRKAIASGAHCFATLGYVGPDAEDVLPPVRDAIGDSADCCEAGASHFDGLTVMRLAAKDGVAMRACIMRSLAMIKNMSLPRGWHT